MENYDQIWVNENIILMSSGVLTTTFSVIYVILLWWNLNATFFKCTWTLKFCNWIGCLNTTAVRLLDTNTDVSIQNFVQQQPDYSESITVGNDDFFCSNRTVFRLSILLIDIGYTYVITAPYECIEIAQVWYWSNLNE